MKTQEQWVPIDRLSFSEIPAIKEFISLNMGFGGEVYIFHNPSKLKIYGEHYGRLKFSENELSRKSYRKLLKKGYDLVFLYIGDSPLSYDIIKLRQKKDETDICKLAGTAGVGPFFKDSIYSPSTGEPDKYIVEEFLSQTVGWNPIYLQQRTIRRHYNIFIESFAEMMSDMHKKGMIYNDEFWKHIFYNPLVQECKLVDFGNSYMSGNPTDIYDELFRIHDFLQNSMFSEKGKEVISIFDDSYDLDELLSGIH
ncbi:MAG: hypothetical protein U9O53_05985 [archaeon]|nr:hypothetical protein [archaeon]